MNKSLEFVLNSRRFENLISPGLEFINIINLCYWCRLRLILLPLFPNGSYCRINILLLMTPLAIKISLSEGRMKENRGNICWCIVSLLVILIEGIKAGHDPIKHRNVVLVLLKRLIKVLNMEIKTSSSVDLSPSVSFVIW